MLVQLSHFLTLLKADRRGVTALEYALMGALIAVVIVTAVSGLASHMENTFNNIANVL